MIDVQVLLLDGALENSSMNDIFTLQFEFHIDNNES